MRTTIVAALSCALLLACGDDGKKGPRIDASLTASPDATTTAAFCSPTAGLTVDQLRLEEVVTGLSSPVLVKAPPGDRRLFIIEQSGRLRVTDAEHNLLPDPFLSIDAVRNGGERGLLGLAFHPDWALNGKFYVSYTRGDSPGESVIEEYLVDAVDGNTALSDTGRIIFSTAQEFGNHNGGMINFGPDGYLYLGLGDGGSGDDPNDRGQDPTTHLGSLLRIDINSSTDGKNYGIPADNPFADGVSGAPEVFAYGLRNPWRWSFDRQTGDVYIADVGQVRIEEVNAVTSAQLLGANFGWDVMEGTECFNEDSSRNPLSSCDTAGKIQPITEYKHTADYIPMNERVGNSITGGYVYRGECLPSIQGTYFYGDFSTNVVRTLEWSGGDAENEQDITDSLLPGAGVGGISSFGEDGFGELYLVSYGGSVLRIVAP